jgi:hypothetical protein
MIRILPTGLALFAATAALGHDATGLAHLHPHGSEAALAALVLAAGGVVLWRHLRRR